MGKTSWQAKAKYNAKTYKVIQVQLKKELVEQFEQKLSKDNMSKSEFIRQAILSYLGE